MTTSHDQQIGPGRIPIRDVSLYVEVAGHGYPLLLMHGGPGADHWTMLPFRQCADRFTLIFYDHRCNGRSEGPPVSSMTWENLTADADALRERFGFERWAVLGHSFGGHVALEYALRYPGRLSHLVLLDTGADSRWSRQNAADLLAKRGYSPQKVELVRRWFTGEFKPREMPWILMRIGPAYFHHPSLRLTARDLIHGEWRSKMRPEALIFAGRRLLKDWSVMDRLGEITVPTLVMAGRDDFLFPPEHQRELAAGILGARLQIIERAGHNAHAEQPAEVMAAVRDFIAARAALARPPPLRAVSPRTVSDEQVELRGWVSDYAERMAEFPPELPADTLVSAVDNARRGVVTHITIKGERAAAIVSGSTLAMSQLLAVLLTSEMAASALPAALPAAFPWASSLPDDHLKAFAGELREAVVAESSERVERVLDDWQAVAEVRAGERST